MVFLQGYGVSPAFAARIYKRYGPAAIARVRENPFRLAFDVWGIGFLSADRLATALGIARDSDVRVEAGVRHALDQAGGLGHVFLPRSRLVEEAAKLLEVEATAGGSGGGSPGPRRRRGHRKHGGGCGGVRGGAVSRRGGRGRGPSALAAFSGQPPARRRRACHRPLPGRSRHRARAPAGPWPCVAHFASRCW